MALSFGPSDPASWCKLHGQSGKRLPGFAIATCRPPVALLLGMDGGGGGVPGGEDAPVARIRQGKQPGDATDES